MAEAAVTFLLENLQKILSDQVHLISGAENELRQLKNELDLMKAFLVESANRREKGELFKRFESQIREVVYEAEDTIDTCLIQAVSASKKPWKRLDMAKRVKLLREDKVKPVFERAKIDFANLQIADPSAISAEEARKKARKMPLLREDNVVGFEDEADTLIKSLTQESEELDVISIIGMPGLGKTTLAWKIYRDSTIQYEFPTKIWVYVSQEFNRRDVFITILRNFINEDMSTKDDNELAQDVRSCLEKPKFILFIDDVWTPEAWKEIEVALPKSNKLGKVLLTSRHDTVARHANPKRDPHKLRFMNPKESWELLQLEVFRNVEDCPQDLEMLGKHIAKQCGGVPLAIVVIGGILVEKSSPEGGNAMKKEWKDVSNRVSAYLSDDKKKTTEEIIKLSYNELSHDLRDCFLYLGMFPEDTEIHAWKLIRLWIAERFIQQKSDKSIEDVATDNLKDLINRNLVMVDQKNADGDVKTCRVHDMIREFCKTEAAIARHNLFQETRKSRQGVFDPPISEIQKYRRLCIHSYVLEFLERKPKGPRVRSFLCFSKEPIALKPENIQSIPDAFELLRVLDASPIKFPKFPMKLFHLIHLRYIALSGNEQLKALPLDISKLWNLQTIRIDTSSRTLDIKANIWKMMQLRHLKTKAAIVINKDLKGEAGENLQTLSRLSAECCTAVLKKAINLKNLGIRGQLATLLDGKSLEKLDHLDKLKLVYDVFPKVPSENALPRLPDANKFPPNMRILELSTMYLDWKHMSTLGKLPSLEVLKLKENAFVGKLWAAAGGGFLSLKFLLIARTDLEFWTAKSDSFPELRCLVLKNCENLQEIPLQLADIKRFEILDIERVHESAVDSAEKIKKEKQQMQGQEHRAKRGGFKLIIAPGDEQLKTA